MKKILIISVIAAVLTGFLFILVSCKDGKSEPTPENNSESITTSEEKNKDSTISKEESREDNIMSVKDDSENWNWYDANMNGMGWVTGVVACPTAPYTIYAKTDVGGVYRLDREQSLNGKQGRWLPLLESFGSDRANYTSVESVAVDPNDGMVVYFAGGNDGGGDVFKSADGGKTWTSTNLTAKNVYMAGNGEGRSETGERLRVDPNNANILYFASRRDGLWRYDGSNWSKVTASGLPAAEGLGYTYAAFDKNSGTQSDGSTSAFYVGADNNGVYITTDGGASFTKAAGENPVNPRAGAVNDAGRFVTASADGVYTAERGGSLTKLKNTASAYGLSLDVHNQDFAALGLNAGDNMYRIGADGSLEWTRKMANGELIPYATYNNWCHPERGGFVIDPADPTGNTGFAGTGFGVVKASDMSASKTSGNVVWDDFTQGIGELVVNFVKVAPIVYKNGDIGPDFQLACADMGGFSVIDRTKVPASRIMLGNTVNNQKEWNIPLTIGTGWDYCWRYPQYMAYTGTHQFANDNALKYGVSRDGGLTWEELNIPASDKSYYGIADPAENRLTGGVIAMSSANPYNLVWSPDLGFPKWSDNMGQTWNDPVNINDLKGSYEYNGAPTLFERSMYWWANAQSLQSDKVKGDTFYLFTAKDGTDAQLWRSADGGKNWTLQYEGNTGGSNDPDKINYYYNPSAKVAVNPAAEGDVFIGYWRSANKDCTDFKRLPDVQQAYSVGFGAGMTADMPWIYIYGKANDDSNFGVYVSKDNGQTWEKITDDSEQLYGVNAIEGDMRQRGLVYLGRGGRGVTVGEIDGGAVDVSDWYICADCEISGDNYTKVCDRYDPANGKFGAWHSSANYPSDTGGALITPKSSAAGEELLINNNFADGVNEWFTYNPDPRAALEVVNTSGDYGDRYISVSGRTQNWDSLAQGVEHSKITAGKYTVSGWVYMPKSNRIQIGLHFPDATAKNLFLPAATKKGEWVYVSGVIEVTKENLDGSEIQFVISTSGGNSSDFYVANLSLTSGG